MSDPSVVLAQKFVNSYSHPQVPKVQENGITGWQVMFALTRILQAELGITTLSDNFGPTTLSALQQKYPNIVQSSTATTVNKVLEAAFFCKGYDAGSQIKGVLSAKFTEEAIRLKTNLGISSQSPGAGITPKVFKALLTMDAYVLTPGGSAEVRSVQQWLNSSYSGRRDFYLVPCDGHFSRDVQKALMLAIQFQLGMSDDVANGNFGPGTQAGMRQHELGVGSLGPWVQFFTAAMIFNQRPGVQFASAFTGTLTSQVREFQQFVKLPVNGIANFQTWAALLVSTGDPNRPGTAVDCITELTDARATTLLNAGYRIVGRYLSNASAATWNKALLPSEIEVVKKHNMSLFPIYQTWGGEADYFNYGQGQADALAAIDRLRYYGFKSGTRVYFAVDFDAVDDEVSSNILPHFRGIRDTFEFNNYGYRVGIYGPRNICSRVSQAGFSTASFVSDMSIGFSGNLGFSLPLDWAFDQIQTLTVGTDTGAIEVDKNVASGRDPGQNQFDPPRALNRYDVAFDLTYRSQLSGDIKSYLESIGVPESGVDIAGAPTVTIHSNTEAINLVLRLDADITAAANRMQIPKSLLQCPILWEYRKITHMDAVADTLVLSHHTTGVGPDDSSTGIAQIFGRTAIDAHNYCVRSGKVGGPLLDSSDPDTLYSVWATLSNNDIYSVDAAAKVLYHAASMVGVHLDRDNDASAYRRTLARYNGTGPDADNYGTQLLGLFLVFEKYNGFLRNR